MAKPTVDFNKVMQDAFKKYGVNVDKITSPKKAVRDAEMLKMAKGWGADWKSANLINWGKENGAPFFPAGINEVMKKAGFTNTQVSPPATKTTPANNAANQWANQLAGVSTEPQKHVITHAEWLFIGAAKNLMTEEQLNAAYNQVQETLVADRMKAIEAEAAMAMQALTGRKPDHVFLREVKEFITGDEYDQKGWGMFNRADKRRLIDMAEAGNEDAKEMVTFINQETEREAPNTSPFEPAEPEAEKAAAQEASSEPESDDKA